ncbi:MAG: ATP synthase F1 subunit gamma [Oscillospiraceae bacterium]|nr:ATP synthase F1 subunit gamma [Oscillospiraceae bacterium]
MANLREIRTRMKSMENTSQITASMKMIAAAKLRKAQTSFESLRNYAEQCGQMLTEASAGVWDHDNPYLTPHPVCRKVCYVLVVGNRGMCGAYNQNLLRYYENLIKDSEEENLLLVCGRWGRDLIAAAGLQEEERLELSDTPTREEAMLLAEKLMKLYRDETADRIVLVYQKFRSLLSQTPCDTQLLPLAFEPGKAPGRDVIFEPDRDTLIDTLLDMYIENTLHTALLEARTGEHAARMTAMTSASDNTEKLLRELKQEFNHARQDAVTTEISEIAGGAEALRSHSAGGI